MAQKPDPKLLSEAEKFVSLMRARATKSILKQCKRWRHDLSGLKASWESLDRTRRENSFTMSILEIAGGAKFPPKADLKKCEHWIYNVENGVAKNYAKQLPQWIKNAESSIKSLDAKIKSYVSRIDGGGDVTVGTLTVAKGAGLVAVGVLAALFAGPAVVTAVAAETTVGTAMITGATASAITKNVEIVSTTFGRYGAGEKIDFSKELDKAVDANLMAVATGTLLGPLGAGINSSVTKKIFERIPIKKFDAASATNVTRLGVGGFNKFVRHWLKTDGKREVPAFAKKVNRKLDKKMTDDAMMLIVLEEAAKSPKFQKALMDYAKKNVK